MPIFVGIDVGGKAKGPHAVALRDGVHVEPAPPRMSLEGLTAWCRNLQPQTIAIDAPCRWSVSGRARSAERELMGRRVWCFSTPTQEAAELHSKGHYGWMQEGEKIYAAFRSTHPIYDGTESHELPCCIETFPHGIVCSLRHQVTSAKGKAAVRRRELSKLGLDITNLKSIDLVDAALCAVMARDFASGRFQTYGDAAEGVIILPPWPHTHD